jgi:hypothetical protein
MTAVLEELGLWDVTINPLNQVNQVLPRDDAAQNNPALPRDVAVNQDNPVFNARNDQEINANVGVPHVNPALVRNLVQNDKTARNLIVLTCSTKYMNKIRHCVSAFETWKQLKQEIRKDSIATKIN